MKILDDGSIPEGILSYVWRCFSGDCLCGWRLGRLGSSLLVRREVESKVVCLFWFGD